MRCNYSRDWHTATAPYMFPVVAIVIILIITHLCKKDLWSFSYVPADVPGSRYLMVN